MRLAVHEGMVLRDMQAKNPAEQLVPVGETFSLPIRLLGHAAPGEIVVSPQVGQIAEGWFELQTRELPLSAGDRDRIVAYHVKGVRTWRSPLARLGAQPRSRFVGRDQELATLRRILAQVWDGRGQAVGLMGEPSVGKSRLLYEFRQSLTQQSVTYLEGRCLPYGTTISYLPVLDLLWDHCGITEADNPDMIAEKVHSSLQQVQLNPDEWAPYLLGLLGVKAGTERLAGLSPEEIKTPTFETLRKMSLHGSRRRP